MKKIIYSLCVLLTVPSAIYAENLAEFEHNIATEQKAKVKAAEAAAAAKKAAKKVQEEEKKKPDFIEDCKQAYEKAHEYSKTLDFDDYKIFPKNLDFFDTKNSHLGYFARHYRVSGFEEDGLFKPSGLLLRNTGNIFVYTNDTDYTTGEKFISEYVWKRAGNYKYISTDGEKISVPAYKITEYKIEDINPVKYMKYQDRSEDNECCMNDSGIYWLRKDQWKKRLPAGHTNYICWPKP